MEPNIATPALILFGEANVPETPWFGVVHAVNHTLASAQEVW